MALMGIDSTGSSRRSRGACVLLALCLASGVGRLSASEPFPGELPASFIGDAPIEGGVASRAVLELHEGNAYVFRNSTRQESTEVTTNYDDIGLWKVVLADTGRQLVLRGGREAPIVFRIDGPEIVTPLDPAGEPWRVAGEIIRLQRTAEFRAIEPQLFLSGMYTYMADAGVFTECLTGWRLPVAMEEDNVALEHAYLEARARPGEFVRVSLEGRIVLRAGPDGSEPRRTLVPVRLAHAWPGRTCEDPGTAESDRPPLPEPSASAVQKLVYVAAERAPCTGVAPMLCLQVRDSPDQPWRLHYGEIIGFTPEPGVEYRLRILEDTVENPPADGSSKRWFLDLVVEQRDVGRP